MKTLFSGIVQLAGAATLLFVSSVHAEDTVNAETEPGVQGTTSEEALSQGPAPVQAVGQPTVGGAPLIYNPIGFRGSPNIRENLEGKEFKEPIPTSERHWKFLLGFTAGVEYDDNIFLTPNGTREHDFIFALAPTIGIQLGDTAAGSNYLIFTYTPTFVIFADHSDQNSVEHAVDLKFVRQTDIWKLAGNIDFQSLNGATTPLRDSSGTPLYEQIGDRVDRQVYTLGLKYDYNLGDKTSYELGLSADGTHYEDFLDTVNLVSQNFLDYAITGKTSIGLGFGVGYAMTEGGPNQIYEQALARIRYFATSKLVFELHGGAEFRQVDGFGDEINGVFAFEATYKVADHTTVGLTAYRNVNPSSLASNLDYTATGVGLIASQKFLGKFTARLGIGYENDQYETIAGPGLSYTFNYFYVRPSLQYQIGDRAILELFYEYRSNDSTIREFQFADNRVGLTLGYAF